MHRRILLVTLIALIAPRAWAGPLPYDETADAAADVQRAQQVARQTGRPTLIVFGANWCEDCRALDRAVHSGPTAALMAREFQVVKVDVGNFDRNLALDRTYGHPIGKGIPAAVLVAPDGRVLYATRGGELADARRMGETGIHDFFAEIASRPRGAAR